jgi:hypothetical protein
MALGFPIWAGLFTAAVQRGSRGAAGLFLGFYGGQALLFGFGFGGRLLVTGFPILLGAYLLLILSDSGEDAEVG